MDDRQALDELNHLLNDWDPIAVVPALGGGGHPLDEYRSYAPGLLGMLNNGAGVTQVAAELARLASQVMGVSSDPKRERLAADHIVNWFSTRASGSSTRGP